MADLSNNAKFYAVAGGMTVSVLVSVFFRLATPAPVYADVVNSMSKFDAALHEDRRQTVTEATLYRLTNAPTKLCDAKERKSLAGSIEHYWNTRRTAYFVAGRYLSETEAAAIRQKWELRDGAKVEEAIAKRAKEGTLSRADFKPIWPDLAALIDGARPVTPVCPA